MRRLLSSSRSVQVLGRQLPVRKLALLAAVPISAGAAGAAVWGYSYYSSEREPTFEERLQQKLGKIKLSSNVHTAKWRVYTDKGRDLFLQGRLEDAERYLIEALEQAKQGFGEEDFHVASSCNNLAELYRTQKDYDKALPLYLRAVDLLEQELGPEHPSMGFALHNLAGFYLLQNDLDNATKYYERALKIKGRGLGLNHPEYASTLFHLGKVKAITGKLQDAEALIRQAVDILEEGGFGESKIAVRKMTNLLEVLLQSDQMKEAEKLSRKILHIVELSEGPESPSTLRATEKLANVLQLRGNLDEAEELYRRSLEIKQKALRGDDMQVWEPLFKVACIYMDRADRLVTDNARSLAEAEYEKAEILIHEAVGIADKNWKAALSNEATPNEATPFTSYLVALAQSLNALGLVAVKRLQHGVGHAGGREQAEGALRQCLLVFSTEGLPELDGVALQEQSKCRQNLAKLSSMTARN